MRSCAVFYVLEFGRGDRDAGRGDGCAKNPCFKMHSFLCFNFISFHFISFRGDCSWEISQGLLMNARLVITHFGEDVPFIGLAGQRVEIGLRNW
jgi:hypothetical protein